MLAIFKSQVSFALLSFMVCFPKVLNAAIDTSIFNFSGSSRVRGEASDKTDGVSNRAFTSFRIRPQLSIVPDPIITAVFEPQFAKIFGEPVYIGNSTTTNYSQDTSSANFDGTLSFHQGYLEFAPVSWNTITVGRQIISYGEELLIGATEWTLTGRTFDAVKAKFRYGLGWSDLIFSKIKDNNTTVTNAGGDQDLYGMYNSFKFGEYLKTADLYVLYNRDDSGTIRSNLWTLGTRLKSEINAFDYRIELTKQWDFRGGQDVTFSNSFQTDLEFGYMVHKETKFRLGAEGFVADHTFNQLYATAHKWLGYADVFGRRNIYGAAFHSSLSPTDELKLSLDYHQFFRTNIGAPAYKLNGVTALGSASRSDSRSLGGEVDLVAKYRFSKKLEASIGGALLVTGKYLRDQTSLGSTVDFYYADLQVTL